MENLPTRQNNPGDIRDTKTGSYKKYASPQEGFDALKNDLNIKISGRSKTGVTPDSSLLHFSSIYAPKADNNDPEQYAKNLATKLGVSVDTPIKDLSNRLDDFANAIADNEGYKGTRVSGSSSSASPEKQIGNNLTHEQMIANINALEQQGAKPEEIQGYLDSLKGSSSAPQQKKEDLTNDAIIGPSGSPEDMSLKANSNPLLSLVPGSKLAQGLGYAIGGKKAQRGLIEANDQATDIQTNLLKRIKEKKSKGEDTSRLDAALKELTGSIQDTGSKVSDAGTGGISNKDVKKSALNLATLPAAAYFSGALSGGGIMNTGRGLETGILGKVGPKLPKALNSAAVKEVVQLGKGETMGSIPRGELKTVLENSLKEMKTSDIGTKYESDILKAIKSLDPMEKKTLAQKVIKYGTGAGKALIVDKVLGGKGMGLIKHLFAD